MISLKASEPRRPRFPHKNYSFHMVYESDTSFTVPPFTIFWDIGYNWCHDK